MINLVIFHIAHVMKTQMFDGTSEEIIVSENIHRPTLFVYTHACKSFESNKKDADEMEEKKKKAKTKRKINRYLHITWLR